MANTITKDKRIQQTVTLPTSKINKIHRIADRTKKSISHVVERGVDAVINEEERND